MTISPLKKRQQTRAKSKVMKIITNNLQPNQLWEILLVSTGKAVIYQDQ